jgi:hypothetical protein
MSDPRADIGVRRRASRLILAASLGLAATASSAACSLLNAFPDVIPVKGSGGAGGSGASSSSSTVASSSSSSSTVASSSSSSTIASSSSSSSSGAGGGDSGADAGTRGIVAVAGRIVSSGIATSQRVFAVLDAETGQQLSRYEQLSIVAAAHDPATDLWYLFEADSLPPLNTQPIKLHVGTIDPADGAWEEQAVASAGLPVIADAIDVGVLNQRLVYAAFDPTFDAGGIPPIGLGVLDTSSAPQVTASAFGGFVSLADVSDAGTVKFNGFVGTPGGSPGGQANLITETCPPTGFCTLTRYLVNVFPSASTTPTLKPDLGTSIPKAPNGISATWGSRDGLYDIVVFPPPPPAPADAGAPDAGTPGLATVQTYSPTLNMAMSNQLAQFGLNEVAGGEQFTGLAYADCSSVLMLAERNAQTLYAVTLPAQPTMTPVQATSLPVNTTTNVVYFDPVTNNLFMPLQPAGTESKFSLLAWHLDAAASPPALSPIPGFSPPSDLAVDVVAVRRPPGFVCPGGT